MIDILQICFGIVILLYGLRGLYYLNKRNVIVVTDDCLLGSFEKINHYECKSCSDGILYLSDKFCNQCGAKLIWRL